MRSSFESAETTFRERHALVIVAVIGIIGAALVWWTTVAPLLARVSASLAGAL